jgi:hypothetical protein
MSARLQLWVLAGFFVVASLPLQAATVVATNVLRIGTLRNPALDESSGLVASRAFPGVFWTHNDADEYLFAVTKRGATLSVHRINNVRFTDWESIGIDGAGNLYLADIGDKNVFRPRRAVYVLREPNPYSSSGVSVFRRYFLTFPNDVPVDCEGFFVLGRYGYIVSKEKNFNDEITIYRFPLASTALTIVMREVARVKVTTDVSAADISRDGKRLALLTDEGAYCLFINGNVASAGMAQSVFTPFLKLGMEAACFAGNGLLVSAETRELYLFNHPAFRTW